MTLSTKLRTNRNFSSNKVHDLAGNNMKFNAVVGNPPYQEVVEQKESSNGQKVSISIFQYFQMISERLGKYTSLIYPGARWIHRSGKGLEKFGMAQINDCHLMMLEFFPCSTDVFKDVAIADGLSIVLKDMGKTEKGFTYRYSKESKVISIHADNPGENLFPLNPNDDEIVRELDKAIKKYGCLHDSVLPRSLFGIESDLLKRIDYPCEVYPMKFSSYVDNRSSMEVKEDLFPDIDLQGRNVYVLEDIADTGLTVHSLSAFLKDKGCATCKIAVLLVKPDKLQVPLKIDYYGFEIGDDYVAGYGLDVDFTGRNLKDIYVMTDNL